MLTAHAPFGGLNLTPGRYAVVIGINYTNFPAGTGEDVQARRAQSLKSAEASARDPAGILNEVGYEVIS